MKSYECNEEVGEDPLGRYPRNDNSAAEFSPFGSEGFSSTVARLGDLFCGGWKLVLPAYDIGRFDAVNPILDRVAAHAVKARRYFTPYFNKGPVPFYEGVSRAKTHSGLKRFLHFPHQPSDLLLSKGCEIIGIKLIGGGLTDFRLESFVLCLRVSLSDPLELLYSQISDLPRYFCLWGFDEYFEKIDGRWEGICTPSADICEIKV